MTCEAMSEAGVSCRIPTPNHRAHFDGTTWWDNTDYRPPSSRKKPGRKRADRVSATGRDMMVTAAERVAPDPTTRPEPEPQQPTWTKESWLAHAEEALVNLLATHDGPFTTPEHLWPLMDSPYPDVDPRVLSVLVQRALRHRVIEEVGVKRLAEPHYSRDGQEVRSNKYVPIYQVLP